MRVMRLITLLLLMVGLIGIYSCEDYLENEPEGLIPEEDLFRSYDTYQSFINSCYYYLVDWNKSKVGVGQQLGGETIAAQANYPSRAAVEGDYLSLINDRSCYNDFGTGDFSVGWWATGWSAIRVANQSIARIDLLTDATEFERDYILGQAYFFRALFHTEIWRAYGAIPYVDEVLSETFNDPRFFDYNGKTKAQAVAERIVEDLDLAIDFLPAQLEGEYDIIARLTKGAALAYKARVLLTAGSPLFNEFSDNSATVDTEYMERAALAATEVLKLVDQGVYGLTPFEEYKSMFCRNDGSFPFTDEVIFAKPMPYFGATNFLNVGIGRLFIPSYFGGESNGETVTQNYVDRYEMADGTKYLEAYDEEDDRRWENRDPRFRETIYVDRDTAGIDESTVLAMYNEGFTRNFVVTPYIVHKYWPKGVNQVDEDWEEFYYHTPLMRLADVYLMYAEAVNEWKGDPNATADGYPLTALEAVNIVRNRAGMPDASADAVAYNGSFRELVLNERAVELAFEGHFWFDQRRWKKKPDPVLYDMQFDEDYTFFSREPVLNTVFFDRHWWLPFPSSVILNTSDFPQNPGW